MEEIIWEAYTVIMIIICCWSLSRTVKYYAKKCMETTLNVGIALGLTKEED